MHTVRFIDNPAFWEDIALPLNNASNANNFSKQPSSISESEKERTYFKPLLIISL